MQGILNLLLILGGVAVFLVGLTRISDNFSAIIGRGVERAIKKAAKSRTLCALIGSAVAGVSQSSAAANMVVVSLADSGVLPSLSACAVIVGTNVGTTVTAQLVALTVDKELLVAAVGSLLAFLGLCLGLFKAEKIKALGKILSGFGFVFIGINLMTTFTKSLYNYDWFKGLFLVKSPLIVLLNGFFITAICQSSSVVTSMLVILSGGGIIGLEQAIYMILGANVGSCVLVIFAASIKGAVAQKTAVFNLVFNGLGAAVGFLLMIGFGDSICLLLQKTAQTNSGAVANFHTVFNIASAVVALPLLKPVSRLTELLVLPTARQKVKKSRRKNQFRVKV